MPLSTMPIPPSVSDAALQSLEISPSSRTPAKPSMTIRRRPDMQQGKALEILGHAVEYLVDSRMTFIQEPPTRADQDAVQILSRCSREVFAMCPEIVPVHQRFKQWAADRLHAGILHSHHGARRV